jgi:hypothetical protein
MSQLTALIRAWRARWSQPQAEESGDTFVLQPIPRPRQRVRVHVDWRPLKNVTAAEYPDLAAGGQAVSAGEPGPIFITARFRTGSTLLWNIFRHTPGITAYYEPLHPWLALPPEQRPRELDPTHYDVQDYWSEYERIPGLEHSYTEPWDREDLYLDALDWKPALTAYIELLIHSAWGRAVLQFNRVDFRLDWLRHVFPHARLVHLFRHPRDQWLSALRSPVLFGPDDPPEQFKDHDGYFLLSWVRDLSSHFPVLDWQRVHHPYRMFYLVWKLSYIWGKAYSGFSLAYEQLLAAPQQTLSDLFAFLDLDQRSVPRLAAMVRPSGNSRWRTYADAAWFAAHERAAEELLDEMLSRMPESARVATQLRVSA